MAEVSLRLLVLKTPRVDRLRAFYHTLGIDSTEERHGEGPLHYTARVGDTILELYPLSGEAGSADTTTRLGFAVSNLAEVIQTLKDAGAAIVREPQPTPWGLRAMVRDPDGRTIELYQK